MALDIVTEETLNAGDDITLTVWWTPDCGCMHLEVNPKALDWVCPDGVPAGWCTE